MMRGNFAKPGDLVRGALGAFGGSLTYEVVSGPWASGGSPDDYHAGAEAPYLYCRFVEDPEAEVLRLDLRTLFVVKTAEERVADEVMGEGTA